MDQVQRFRSGHRDQAANAGGDRPFADDLEQADVARAGNVCPAAELDRRADLQDAHLGELRVLVSEEREGPRLHRRLGIHHRRPGLVVLIYELVHAPLDLQALLVGERLIGGVIEAQIVGGHHGPGLLHALAEDLAQRPVQQVRRAVVTAQTGAALGIDDQLHFLPDCECSFEDLGFVGDQSLDRPLRVEDLRPGRAAGDEPGVADLSTGFAVERRPIERQLAFFSGRDLRNPLSGYQDRLQRRFGRDLLVPEELALSHLGGERFVHVGDRCLAGSGERAASALLLHQFLERVDVDARSALGGDHLRQIEREPVRVVQLESQVAGDPLTAPELLAEDGVAAIERAQEQIGLVLDGIDDADARLHQLGIRLAHELDHLCADPRVEARIR